jgi:hypothetical protein
MAFDASYIVDTFKCLWDNVFTALSLPTENVIPYYDYRQKSTFHIPSVYIRVISGATSYENTGMRNWDSSNPDLHILWTRQITIEMVVIGAVKGETDVNHYAQRLYSLFLREFTQRDLIDAGTINIADADNDQKRRVRVQVFRELKPDITVSTENLNKNREIMTIQADVQFNEHISR